MPQIRNQVRSTGAGCFFHLPFISAFQPYLRLGLHRLPESQCRPNLHRGLHLSRVTGAGEDAPRPAVRGVGRMLQQALPSATGMGLPR